MKCHFAMLISKSVIMTLVIWAGAEVFTQPRELLSSISGLVIKEMHWNREQAYCCRVISELQTKYRYRAVLDLVKEIKATQAPLSLLLALLVAIL